MAKIKLTFTRTRTEEGTIEIDVTDEVAQQLNANPRDLDAWAHFTMGPQVKNWKPMHLSVPGNAVDRVFKAEADGVPMNTLYRKIGGE